MTNADLPALSAELDRIGRPWEAQETPFADLSEDQKRALLGVEVDEGLLRAAMSAPPAASERNFAASVDWRDRNGSHVTIAKSQGECGSCVSFCVCALIESMSSIEHGQPLDLSEADLHFCSSHGPTCNGWWPESALAEVKRRGVPDDAAFPYLTAFTGPGRSPVCKAVSNRDARAVKISRYNSLVSAVDRKNHLSNVGPCAAVMVVYDDLYNYKRGVYRHVRGNELGLHCVLVIGYSESEGTWICKNSWGRGWGDRGFFKIAYGQCEIDGAYPFYGVLGVQLPKGFRQPQADVAVS